MRLNHLHLTVTDVPAAKQFLQTYFGLRAPDGGKANPNFDALIDESGLVLTLMQAKAGSEMRYPGHFHIGFIREYEEEVNALNARLKADGYAVEPPVRAHGWTFYVEAPGGFTVEVLC